MNNTFDFYSLDSGEFIGRSWSGDAEHLLPNMPDGCGAYVGADVHGQAVNLKTGALVVWTSKAPADTHLVAWKWDGMANRWAPEDTLEAHILRRTQAIQFRLEALEAGQARPIRELVNAQLAGVPLPQDAIDKLASITATIKALQAVRSAVASAESKQELDSIKEPKA